MKVALPASGKRALRLARRRWGRYPVVYDANGVGVGDARGRRAALLEYLPHALLLRPNDPELLRHTNLTRCRRMVEVLGELGYVVDVTNKRDRRFRPRRAYELVVSERPDWRTLERGLPPEASRILLASSLEHTLHNANVRRRHQRLAERRRPPVKIRRIYPEKMPALAGVDAVAGCGNSYTMGTWQTRFAGPILPFDNYAFPVAAAAAPEVKDFARARLHFLFFASRSQVQKGLDLLLEIFPRHPRLHLYVCSGFAREPDFCACYQQELFETPNVHPVGWLSVASAELAGLYERCAFVIHPSCSDGQAGSVIQCMQGGLVPLVTRETGIDTDGFGVTFEDDSLEEIERVILDVAERPPVWHAERAAEARRAASERYSEAAFVDRWRAIVAEAALAPRSDGLCG
jgi:glycosyltransferase involved in cell wall biosynthesis